MTNKFRAVQWNRQKQIYDFATTGMVLLFVASFVILSRIFFPPPEDISIPVLLIRALGICALIMLHVIMVIGPLARLTPLASPLLYNRRHLGVTFFIVATFHALLVLGFYGGFGTQNPLTAVLNGIDATTSVPFEFFGFLGLLIFLVMAATSHDFWLSTLGHTFWKCMHMGVYIAYALIIAHVVFGVLRSEHNLLPLILLTLGAATIVTLHLISGLCEVMKDHRSLNIPVVTDGQTTWIDVGSVDDIKPDRAMVVQIDARERIAVFRHDNTVSAITNVCAHQGGPLGEGKVVDGCVTCPWHGYQYKPACGQSPPPYTEKITTFNIRIEGRRVLVNPEPNEPGTHVEPAPFEPWVEDAHDD